MRFWAAFPSSTLSSLDFLVVRTLSSGALSFLAGGADENFETRPSKMSSLSSSSSRTRSQNAFSDTFWGATFFQLALLRVVPTVYFFLGFIPWGSMSPPPSGAMGPPLGIWPSMPPNPGGGGGGGPMPGMGGGGGGPPMPGMGGGGGMPMPGMGGGGGMPPPMPGMGGGGGMPPGMGGGGGGGGGGAPPVGARPGGTFSLAPFGFCRRAS
uniref:Uncharacterized protein n=1 Tax=Ixodes ricinus TaxID=34613 RepID=A0A6B0V1T0_IXORI